MELTHLRYFRAIAECGSLTAAARVLGVTQPTLSAAVQRLEQHFGSTLLDRTARGVNVTTTGQALLRHADEVFATLDRAEQSISGLENEDVGRFVLGCNDSLGAYFLPAFMRAHLRDFPRIELALRNAPSSEVLQRVVEREIHFGLVVNPAPHPDLVLVELFQDAVDVFALDPAPTLEAAHARLRTGPLILAGRVAQSQAILDALSRQHPLPARILTCGELELVKALTLGGVGLGILPRRVAAYNAAGKLHRLHPDLPFIPDRIVLAWRADLHRTGAALRVKDTLIAYGRRLAVHPEPAAVDGRAGVA